VENDVNGKTRTDRGKGPRRDAGVIEKFEH